MPLCHRDLTPESISLQQCSVAKVRLRLLGALLGEGCWVLGRVCALSPVSCAGLWEQLSPVATCRGTAAYQDRPKPLLHNSPHLPHKPWWLNILFIYRNLGLLTPPRPAAAAGEVLEFPAQPDSAQSSSTFLPPLGCGV